MWWLSLRHWVVHSEPGEPRGFEIKNRKEQHGLISIDLNTGSLVSQEHGLCPHTSKHRFPTGNHGKREGVSLGLVYHTGRI